MHRVITQTTIGFLRRQDLMVLSPGTCPSNRLDQRLGQNRSDDMCRKSSLSGLDTPGTSYKTNGGYGLYVIGFGGLVFTVMTLNHHVYDIFRQYSRLCPVRVTTFTSLTLYTSVLLQCTAILSNSYSVHCVRLLLSTFLLRSTCTLIKWERKRKV